MFRPSDQRILAGVAATLTCQFRDQDGEPTAPAGTVTVAVASEATADVVLAAGTATVTPTDTTTRTVSLTAAQTSTTLDRWVCRWSIAGTVVATTYVDLVGGYFASASEVRDADDKIQSGAKYPPALFIAKRHAAEVLFEDVTNQAWVPRYDWVRIEGTGTPTIQLPHPYVRRVVSVWEYNADGSFARAWTPTELGYIPASDTGTMTRIDGGFWTYGYAPNLIIEFEHGHDRPPNDLLEAWKRYLRYSLTKTKSAIPDRATSFSSPEGGTYALTTPGIRGSITGIPDVDEVLDRYRFVDLGFS